MSGAQYRLAGQIIVPLPPDEAFVLFTPRGEEQWVEGWRPNFPVPTEDDTAPGTVFETSADGEHTVWLVLDREPGRRMLYARVTPSSRAGTVSVALEDAGDGSSKVAVTYAMTALSPDGDRQLKEFATAYPDFLRSWQAAISGTI